LTRNIGPEKKYFTSQAKRVMKLTSKKGLKAGEKKRLLRQKVLKLRNSLTLRQRKIKSASIFKKLKNLQLFKKAKTVMFYMTYGSEVMTEKMIKESIKMGKNAVIPALNLKMNKIIPKQIKSLKDVYFGSYGIREPKKGARIAREEDIDIVITPGVAFDMAGARLGYGKGYYDRFLSKIEKKKRIGAAFKLQIVEKLPRTRQDLCMGSIITER
jgi:5-formyltetrahydrofolate cyclo-ligase